MPRKEGTVRLRILTPPQERDRIMTKSDALCVALLAAWCSVPVLTASCAALQTPAAKTAYDTVLPYARDAITRYFKSRGEQPTIESGGCFDEPIVVDDEDGLTWFVCAATGEAP